jgi:hypothetical protein
MSKKIIMIYEENDKDKVKVEINDINTKKEKTSLIFYGNLSEEGLDKAYIILNKITETFLE